MQRYISSELTHFVGKGLSEEAQYGILVKIISEGFLSHPPHSRNITGNLLVNPNAKISENEMFNPQVVCFCDIPIDDLPLHMSKYSQFGLAFDKNFVVSKGGRPVLYIPTTSSISRNKSLSPAETIERLQSGKDPVAAEDVSIGKVLDEIFQDYHALLQRNSDAPGALDLYFDLSRHIFSFVKFFNPSLPDDHPDNFYFEREWRIVGNLDFSPNDVIRVLLPQNYSQKFREDVPQYVGQVCFSRTR
jgi:hypothetical protein